MNVAKGDLAMLVNCPHNSGCIGTVGDFMGDVRFVSENSTLIDVWTMHFPRPVQGKHLTTGEKVFQNQLLVGDKCLRRIAGPNIEMTPDPVKIKIGEK